MDTGQTTRTSESPRGSQVGDAEFPAALLAALSALAARGHRREAEVGAALRRAGLGAGSPRVTAALRLLRDVGCVTDLHPLPDGGLLLTVTGRPLHAEGAARVAPPPAPAALRPC